MARPPEFRRGQHLRAEDLAALAGALDRLRRAGGHGFQVGTAGGMVLPHDGSFLARLTGAGPAYGFVEVYGTAGGGHADQPGGRTNTSTGRSAYDRNRRTGLAPKVVRLVPSLAGDYRFTLPTIGTTPTAIPCTAGCPPTSTAITFSINYTDCASVVRTASATATGSGSTWQTTSSGITLTNTSCHTGGSGTNLWVFRIQCISGTLFLTIWYNAPGVGLIQVAQYSGIKSDSTCSPLFLDIDLGHLTSGSGQTWINSIIYTP